MVERAIKPEEYFHLRDGRVLTDLKELLYALKGMRDDVFNHHITQDRNDFGNWILHVFKERDLAEKVFNSKSKEDIVNAMEGKISPPLSQLEIEDRSSPKRFDFRQQMASQFETVKEAYEKQKEQYQGQPEQKSDLVSESQKHADSLEEVVQPDGEFKIGRDDNPNLKEIVAQVKKKRGRPKKEPEAQVMPEPMQNGTDVSALQKASELVKAYPFEKTTARQVNEQAQEKEKVHNEILEKEKEAIGKLDEILIKEKELELREQKILEIEERLEKELMEIANRKEPRFFSKEFVHGLLIGLLTALIVGLVYVKFLG